MPAAGASLAAPRRLVPRLRSGSRSDHHHHDQGRTHTPTVAALRNRQHPTPEPVAALFLGLSRRQQSSPSAANSPETPLPSPLELLLLLLRPSLTPRLSPRPVRMRQQGLTVVAVCLRPRTSKQESRQRRRVSVVISSWRDIRWFHLVATYLHNPDTVWSEFRDAKIVQSYL